jgi:hypothetical protein
MRVGSRRLSERAVDRAPGNAETLRDRSGTQRGPQLLDVRRIDADRAALDLPAAFALAMPSRWRSSMISRSQVATPARIVSISLLVGLRVSVCIPRRCDFIR